MEIELRPNNRNKKTIVLVSILILVMLAFLILQQNVNSIQREALSFATVRQGDIDVYTDVYGELISAKEQLLTAPARGNVSSILVYPGSLVTQDTVILILTNPQLEQALNQAKASLAEMQSQRAALDFEQQNERLNFLGRIEDIKSELEQAQLEKSVQNQLRDLGVASSIEFQRASLRVKQYTQRLSFEQQRYAQFIAMQEHNVKQMDISLNQQQAETHALVVQLGQMQVRAGMSGTLQSLDIELGENVQLGQALAKVGSDTELVAKLRLPRNQADQIDIDAPVIIDTQKGLMQGRIQRIESIVTNNSVRADAIIESPLSSNARPSLSISAKVFVSTEKNALYLQQQAGFKPNSQQDMFILDGEHRLLKTSITFGASALDKVLITHGLAAGDQVARINANEYPQNTYQQFSELTIAD